MQAKYIKIVPLAWENEGSGSNQLGPALRLNVNTIDKQLQKGTSF